MSSRVIPGSLNQTLLNLESEGKHLFHIQRKTFSASKNILPLLKAAKQTNLDGKLTLLQI